MIFPFLLMTQLPQFEVIFGNKLVGKKQNLWQLILLKSKFIEYNHALKGRAGTFCKQNTL